MMSKKHPINWEALMRITNNKPELAKEMVAMFIAELPTLQQKITHAYTQNDMELLLEHVHKLHGSCCYCGVIRLQSIANDLERVLKNKQSTQVPALYDKLLKEIIIILTTTQDDVFIND